MITYFLFFQKYNKLFVIQEQFPLDEDDEPVDEDEPYEDFFANWYPKVAEALEENPTANNGTNVSSFSFPNNSITI